MNSVYLITGKERSKDRFGTGFVIHKDNTATWLVTCAHVVRDVGEPLLAGEHPAEVVNRSDSEDIALLRVDRSLDAEPLPLFVGRKKGTGFFWSAIKKAPGRFTRRRSPAIWIDLPM